VIITPSFSPFSAVVSNQRFSSCSCAVDVGFMKVSPDSFVETVFKMNIKCCCHLCCSSSMIYRHSPVRCTTILLLRFGFRPLFLSADDVLPQFVSAIIPLRTAALDTPNEVAIWLQMLHLNAHQQSVLFENLTSLPFCSTFI